MSEIHPQDHVGTVKWDARFQFSFWHNSVRLWSVTPAENEPNDLPVLPAR